MSPLYKDFPELQHTQWQPTSPSTPVYNCIAWAAGDINRFWWPNKGYWPEGVQRQTTLAAFQEAFGQLGYQVCGNGNLEPGIEKIVIYANVAGTPTHAARQLANGMWTSKLGSNIDISHVVDGLSGGSYGTPAVYMCRPRITPATVQ